MSENKRVTKNNPEGFPVPDDAQFTEHWQNAENRADFEKRLKDAGLYMSYATTLSRVKAVNEDLKANGLPTLKEMPRKTRASTSVDTDSVVAVMERIKAMQEKEAEATAE